MDCGLSFFHHGSVRFQHNFLTGSMFGGGGGGGHWLRDRRCLNAASNVTLFSFQGEFHRNLKKSAIVQCFRLEPNNSQIEPGSTAVKRVQGFVHHWLILVLNSSRLERCRTKRGRLLSSSTQSQHWSLFLLRIQACRLRILPMSIQQRLWQLKDWEMVISSKQL